MPAIEGVATTVSLEPVTPASPPTPVGPVPPPVPLPPPDPVVTVAVPEPYSEPVLLLPQGELKSHPETSSSEQTPRRSDR